MFDALSDRLDGVFRKLRSKGKLSEMVLRMIRRTTLPVLHVDADAFSVAAEVQAGNFKILPGDDAKIKRAVEIVQDRVDLDGLLAGLKT